MQETDDVVCVSLYLLQLCEGERSQELSKESLRWDAASSKLMDYRALHAFEKRNDRQRDAFSLNTTMAPPPDEGKRQKKSKLEKICELESTVKTLKEENRRLRKDLTALKASSGKQTPYSLDHSKSSLSTLSTTQSDVENVEKLKDVIKALKKVTVGQEMSLSSMRARAHQRRKELQEKDSKIGALQRQVLSLQKAMEGSGSDVQIRVKLSETQRMLYDKESENESLRDRLHESQALVKKLEAQAQHSLNASQHSCMTVESDAMKLRKQVAVKSERVVQLERELDALKDQLFEKQRIRTSSSNKHPPVNWQDSFAINAFDSNPFKSPGADADEDYYYESEEAEGDEW